MACLYSKHFGDKVYLSDLNSAIVHEMLKVPQLSIRKIHNFGILGRFSNGVVGVFVCCIDKSGYITLLREPTSHKTIFSWADFHTCN